MNRNPASDDASGDLGFAWRKRKSGEIHILHHGKPATILRGTAAAEFMADMETLDPPEAQQLMARLTGNYKRGNERRAASHPRNRK